MAISAREAGDAHFVDSEYGYDAVQVDAYVARVASTLSAHERDIAEARAEIGRLEHALDLAHAVQSTLDPPPAEPTGMALGQALETAGADPGEGKGPAAADEPVSPVDPWVEIAAWAEAVRVERANDGALEGAHEEVRRLRGVADALATEAAVARHGIQAGLSPTAEQRVQTRAQHTIDAAVGEAAHVLSASLEEAESMVAAAESSADSITRAAEQEAKDLSQRTAQLRTALRDAGSRFDDLAGSTRTEIRMLEDFIDLEMHAVDELVSLATTYDDPDPRDGNAPQPVAASPDEPAAGTSDEAPGFYERRLAGLRQRLENS